MTRRKFGSHIFESSREDKVFFADAGVTGVGQEEFFFPGGLKDMGNALC